jgi:FMN reductase
MPSDHPPKIVGLGGSLAATSQSLTALRVAAAAAEEEGAHVTIFEVKELDLPFYAPGREPSPQAAAFADAVYEARGLLLSSPMYHGTISGSFKNALDWLELLARREPPFLTDKIVGLSSMAAGVQGLQAVNTLEFVVRALRGWAIPLVIPISRRQAFDGEGRIVDERVVGQLRALGHEVAAICLKRRPAPYEREGAGDGD